jgi:hypothetical protein
MMYAIWPAGRGDHGGGGGPDGRGPPSHGGSRLTGANSIAHN